MVERERLKTDTFGAVERERLADGRLRVRRDTRTARRWAGWLARLLARREARALRAAAGISGVPALIGEGRTTVVRSWLAGAPMQAAKPRDPAYFREALRLLRRLHARRIAHNDLAKEPNWLVLPSGEPGLVDFQLASVCRRRGRWFRLLAREDLRHLMKHKRSYCPAHLSARQRRLLAEPAWISRLWMASGKRVYLLVTRRLLGWRDREGAGDRQHPR